MKVKELYAFYNDRIPPALTEEGDNDGLMCCPSPEREVKTIIFALDITDEVINCAIEKGAQVIISHHPIIYRGLREINCDNFIGSKIIKLIKNDIAAFSFHTRLDAVGGGVNDILCEILGIGRVSSFGGDRAHLGRVGYLPQQMKIEDFALLVKEKLSCDYVSFSDCGKPVSHVAILGGKGSDYIGDALSIGADTYLSGELGYHNVNDSKDFGINLIEAGHFFTENPVCKKLANIAKEADPNIYYEIIISYTVKTL
jgi:dinuclear metal center YbgI/SA1388 family protein